MSAEFVNVALCNDKKYEAGLHVTLLSTLQQLNPARVLRVFFFHHGFDACDIARLDSTLAKAGRRYELVAKEPDTDLFKGFPSLHGNYLTYVRLLVGEMVPVDRVLFLDSDLMVNLDVSELFDADLRGRCLGVVANGVVSKTNDQALLKALGMKDDTPYFNAAVLAMDAAMWRAKRYSPQCLEFLHENRREKITVDQTALNFVLRNDYQPLPAKYNISIYPTDPPLSIRGKPGIFHLCGSPKPWDAMGKQLHGNFDLFEGYRAQTTLPAVTARWLTLDHLWRTIRLSRSYWRNLLARARRRLSRANGE